MFTYSGPSLSVSNRFGSPLPRNSSFGSSSHRLSHLSTQKGRIPEECHGRSTSSCVQGGSGDSERVCPPGNSLCAGGPEHEREVEGAVSKLKCCQMLPLKLVVSQFQPKMIMIATIMIMITIMCQTLALSAPCPSPAPAPVWICRLGPEPL